MKLSEHVSVKSSGALEDFVNVGSFTPGDQKTTTCDHGLVVMFQDFHCDWTQVLGTFASRSNVKAGTLSKILLEATLLAEQAGLFVDFVTFDGASWNRNQWVGVNGWLQFLWNSYAKLGKWTLPDSYAPCILWKVTTLSSQVSKMKSHTI
ncbi:hypothetical protein HPB47_017837 [Ixodes persulcatus]|uniref:Uncharacterized protein n=1 Tax=Ixodes persulcatus TaxID=34615 RepID=A0AC60QN95_IXOPE|nr:hypothetical protein HPB47_017837 [Ixodes persulcatus]